MKATLSRGLACLALVLLGLPLSGAAEMKIGVLLWNNQARYEQCKDGLVEELRQEGFAPPKVSFVVEEANGNKATAAELAEKFASSGMNIIVPIGTSAAVPVAARIKDLPVVFAFVFDPVEAKIAQDWKSSGNNTTGSSSKTSASTLLSSLKQLGVKRLGVLYTPGEKNTEAQLADIEALKDPQIHLTPVALGSRTDIVPAFGKLEGNVEAVLLTGSSIVGDTASQIVVLANKAKIITATQSEDHMGQGVLLGITVDAALVGRLAGKKVAMVLKGAKPSTIEIEALKTSDLVLNVKTAKAIGLEIPASLKKAAVRLIE